MITTDDMTVGQELVELGWEVNAHQYRLVHLAAEFDDGLEWFRHGAKSAAQWISERLGIESSTAREWIRVGHALKYLPAVDAAFGAQEISYAKVRILTRWADADNEDALLGLAHERAASRLTVAIARVFADDGETDEERDVRLHESRSLTTWTDADGMTVIRIVLPPAEAKPVVAAVDQVVSSIARMPVTDDASADACDRQSVVDDVTDSDDDASADASDGQTVVAPPHTVSDVRHLLREMRRRWQPERIDEWFPTLAQQRADGFVALFLGLGVEATTEVVVHVRGDGTTFDDGTPTTDHAVLRQLDRSFIRLLIHDAEGRPINASGRRRFPTTRQKRVVMEAHAHECVDCQSTDLLELDHNPPFSQTRRTVTSELEPRCAPCHRARHRFDPPRSAAA